MPARFRAPVWLALPVILALFGVAAAAQQTVTLQPGDTLDAQCSTALSGSFDPHSAHLACGTPGATTTATRTPPPTGTPPTPTRTLAPTATMVAELIEGVPLCLDHDKTTWHPLVKRDATNTITCTYGHEHHADPATADDIFGPVGAWYGGSQTISYPWQTSNATTGALENDAKHNGYKWYVERNADPSCTSRPGHGCIVAFRVEVHALGTASDAVVRFHSFSEEALVEYNGLRGIVRYGGWMDTGHLALQTTHGHVCPALPSDPPIYSCEDGPFREVGAANLPNGEPDYFLAIGAWYAQPITPLVENFGPVDYADPAHQLLYPDAHQNNSRGRVTNFAFSALYDWLIPYRSADGKTVTFSGYTDRNRQIVQGCTQIGVDCFPFNFEAFPVAEFELHDVSPITIDYDVMSPSTGKSLIRFPN